MGKKGKKPRSGAPREAQRVSGIDMGSNDHHGLVRASVMTLVVGICVAQIRSELAPSRSVRKSALKMDEAFLVVVNDVRSELILSAVSDECHQCRPQPLGVVSAASRVRFTVSTQHPLTLQLNTTPSDGEQCRVHFHFGEHGNYSLWVSDLNCTVATEAEPINSYLPILFAFLACVGLYVSVAVWNAVLRLDCMRNVLLRCGNGLDAERLINSDLGSPSRPVEFGEVPGSSSRRLRSLDTFRGFALVVMVFVNYGGGRYWFFRHRSWNGLTVADLVFPWFVFIMGTSVSLSVSSTLSRGVRRSAVLMKICWRTLQLFLIGVFIINPNYCSGPLSWEELRIPGVLQRLAFTYLIISILHLCFRPTGTVTGVSTDSWWFPVHDVALCWPAWVCVLALETLWLCLTFLLPVPGCPTGYLGPGGLGDFGQYPNCTGGAAALIDRWLLGEKHMYQTPSSRVVYQSTVPFDPEGVLGSINSVLMAFLGLQAGRILQHYRDRPKQILSCFLLWAFILGVISAVLTRCSTESGFVPVNKNLWSVSYVTVLSCFAFVLLSGCYYAVDVKRCWSGAPFYYPGMNSILVYVGHEVLEGYFPFRWKMRDTQSHAEHLSQNLVGVAVWIVISYILYRKKLFWKI